MTQRQIPETSIGSAPSESHALALNLDKAHSMEILYKHIQKNNSLRLSEIEKNIFNESICVDIKGKSYITEISCSLFRPSVSKYPTRETEPWNVLQNENRSLMLLQDGWIYAKLYQLDDRENETLNYIVSCLGSIGNPKFFYLRYSDEIGRHLRVRFKYENEWTAQKHLLAIQKMLINFRTWKLINKVQFDIYFRENNRYGGSQLIASAEEVFFADSRFVIGLLDEFNIEETEGLENAYDKIKLAEGANGGTLMSQFTSFTTLIGQAITSLSYIVILLHFNYIIILIIVIMPIIKFLITNLINKKQFCIIKARTNQERKAWYYSFIVTNGTHFKELKTYNLLNYFIKKYDDLYKKFNQQDAAIAKETMVKMTSLSIIEQIITGAIFAYIIYCGFVGGILLGDVVAYTRAAISNQTNIQSILQNISSIKKSNLYIGQYYSFIDLENAKTLDEGKIIIDKIHSLKLENLSFKYDTGGYVLKNVNFEFKEGNSYAIVGKNGSGKTTLAKLLMGLYDNYEGNIYVNGIELRSIQKEHYSKRIASLFQDFIKYDATFRENIAYGNLDLMDKDAELRDLSNEFRIGHIIDHSKQNLDTQLGYWFDEGKQISFGEWQKLAIARTFSKDADVIFLDEPNSALDAISDYEISQLYQKLFQDKMGIIIAHKFNNLINQVNNILVIENGRLAESGTHTELLHQGKIYYEMYQLQNKNSAVL